MRWESSARLRVRKKGNPNGARNDANRYDGRTERIGVSNSFFIISRAPGTHVPSAAPSRIRTRRVGLLQSTLHGAVSKQRLTIRFPPMEYPVTPAKLGHEMLQFTASVDTLNGPGDVLDTLHNLITPTFPLPV